MSVGDDKNGMFCVPMVSGETMNIIASSGEGWDHVSVSFQHRCPTWDEMKNVKEEFFEEDEVAIMIHPKKEDYVNFHPNCLHWWRPLYEEIPMPPKGMIA